MTIENGDYKMMTIENGNDNIKATKYGEQRQYKMATTY